MDADVNNKLNELLKWVQDAHKEALREFKDAYFDSNDEHYYSGQCDAFAKAYDKIKSMI